MAVVNAEIRFAPKDAAWVTANAAVVFQNGEVIYRSTDGKYVLPDGVLALSALTWYGGISSSGLTIGTSTITSGTNTRILYNNAGVVGEYLVTGTGTTAVLSTSPTFTNDITTPLIIGGTAVGSVIQYKGTTGNGTSTVAAHQFLVGNNGATTAASIYNDGQFIVGTNTRIGGALGIFQTSINGGTVTLGSASSNSGSIWFNQSTPTASSYNLYGTSGTTFINGPGTNGSVHIRSNDVVTLLITGNQNTWTPAARSDTHTAATWQFTMAANSGNAATQNVPNVKFSGNTATWATGALATQYFNYFSANTVAFVGASTATNVYGLYVEAATAGTNATITNNYALGTSGAIHMSMDTATAKFQSRVGGTSNFAIYNVATPDANNFSFSSDGATATILNNPSYITMRIGNSDRMSITSGNFTFTPATLNGNSFLFTIPAGATNMTASTERVGFQIDGGSKSWLAGALTLQQNTLLTSPTYSFASASTLTTAANLSVQYVQGGTSATITTSAAIYVPTLALTNTTTAYGIYSVASTGATNNHAAGFSGNVEVLSGRLELAQGADVSSANNLVLGGDGNVFEITGTTQVNLISNLSWKNGCFITLLFTSNPTVKHNQATASTNITIQLAGAVDFVASAGDTLTLVLCEIGGTQAWREVSRAVI
jgi:hypothetical protein